jgi:hypothetical protein
VENFAGRIETEIGQCYTYRLRIQHRSHYSIDSFDVDPTDSECDATLPFWWIAKHQPNYAYGPSEGIRFNQCRNCSKEQVEELSLNPDSQILEHPEALMIRSISSNTSNDDPLSLDPERFMKWTNIMTKEAVQRLPTHKPYDHAIDLKDGETPPWGPVYALSATELEVLREWLKEMLDTGKIRRSKSPAAAPILFVPKPHGRGLRLCVDYGGIKHNNYRKPIPSSDYVRTTGSGQRQLNLH